MTQMPYNFQQWMSWLPQRWRTQRNAIRNAIRMSSRIIKSLNAHCTSGNCWKYASLSVRKPTSTKTTRLRFVLRRTLKLQEWFFIWLLLLHFKFRALRGYNYKHLWNPTMVIAVLLYIYVRNEKRGSLDRHKTGALTLSTKIPIGSQMKQEDPLNLSI